MNALTIAGADIRTDDDGRFCLNDLHRAAGSLAKHRPGEWLRNKQTKELIAALGDAEIPAGPVVTVNDGVNNGTYVAKELVYAYAMWISPKFHLRVIRAYDALVKQELERLNGLHHRAVRAELEFLYGMKDASRCGIGLRQWRKDRPQLEKRLAELEHEMQPVLFHLEH